MKTFEDNEKYDFNFDNDEEASEWRDKLRDAGVNANMPTDVQKGIWTVRVTKHDVLYSFWQEWINLRSPEKMTDKSSKYEIGQCIGFIKRIENMVHVRADWQEIEDLIKEFLRK